MSRQWREEPVEHSKGRAHIEACRSCALAYIRDLETQVDDLAAEIEEAHWPEIKTLEAENARLRTAAENYLDATLNPTWLNTTLNGVSIGWLHGVERQALRAALDKNKRT